MGLSVLKFYVRHHARTAWGGRRVVMKRVILLAVAGLLATAGSAWSQIQSTVKVGLSIEGVVYYVDGRQYDSTQVFLWPEGSKHTIQFLLSVDSNTGESLSYQSANLGTIRYTFSTWSTNGPPLLPADSTVLVFTASSKVTSILGQITALY